MAVYMLIELLHQLMFLQYLYMQFVIDLVHAMFVIMMKLYYLLAKMVLEMYLLYLLDHYC